MNAKRLSVIGHALDEHVAEPLRVLAAEFSHVKMKRLHKVQMLDPVHLVVHKWLIPISVHESFHQYGRSEADAQKSFKGIAKQVEALIQGDPRFAQILQVIVDFASQPVSDFYLAAGQHWRDPSYTPLKTYLAVVHARAMHVLRSGWFDLPESTTEITRWLTGDLVDATMAQIKRKFEEFGPRFTGHLIMEAEYRAAEDPDFRHRLDTAIQAFEEHVGQDKRAHWSGARAEQVSALSAPENKDSLGLHAHIALAFTLWD